jgi:tRNA-dihydrouridine synthase
MANSIPTLVLAPMRGLTTRHYRQAYARHFNGLDVAIAPFIPTVKAERINPKLLKDVLPENNVGLPLIPQIIGNNADDFVQMNIALHNLGYGEINWNLGCPHKPIRKKCRGSGLLPHPETVDAILDQVCGRSPLQVSVKVRLGVSGKSELMKLIPVLNRYPLSEVIIHPRTAEQMYDGTVDLDAFEEAFNGLTRPVCYNGDIDTPAFYNRIQTRFPAISRFMLGRGLLSNPFLGELIKGVNTEPGSAVARITAFHDDLLAGYEAVLHGDHPVLGKMKEFWTYQCVHLSNGANMFRKIKKTRNLSTYRSIVSGFLSDASWTAPFRNDPDPR